MGVQVCSRKEQLLFCMGSTKKEQDIVLPRENEATNGAGFPSLLCNQGQDFFPPQEVRKKQTSFKMLLIVSPCFKGSLRNYRFNGRKPTSSHKSPDLKKKKRKTSKSQKQIELRCQSTLLTICSQKLHHFLGSQELQDAQNLDWSQVFDYVIHHPVMMAHAKGSRPRRRTCHPQDQATSCWNPC